MKFATKIVALQHRQWSKYYLDYNGLKRILAEIDDDDDDDDEEDGSDFNFYDEEESSPSTVVNRKKKGEISLLTKTHLDDEAATSAEFLAELYKQVQTITLFVIKEQGLIADELVACEVEQEHLKAVPDSTDAVLDPQRFRSLRERYNHLGANLLHLIQFVDLNVKGILRILKKHDKRVTKYNRAYDLFLVGKNSRSAIMMASLRQEASLDALCVKLQMAYTELRIMQEQELSQSPPLPSASLQQDLERGRRLLPADSRVNKRGRSPKGLGRRHRSIQGLQALANVDDNNLSFRDFRPLTGDHRLSVLEDQEQPFHQESLSTGQVELNQDDFIMAQIYAARRNLKQNDEVMNMLATTALGFLSEPPEIIMPGQDGRIKAEYERAAALEAYKRSSAISGILNFISSFIYMANYLIVVPTVVTYSEKLGANPALSSAIVGMTPFATIFSTIVYSWWTSYSYRTPLLFAASLNVVGNLIYALGYPCKSMTFVLLGRLLSGLGSCRPINRRYIADAYSTAERTAASAHFVAVGSFGMALGPFLGSVLHRIAEHSKSSYWQVENAPGWFMAGVWLVYVIFHVFFFVDPPKEEDITAKVDLSKTATVEGEKKPLLAQRQESISSELLENRVPIWKNAAVMVNFFIYFVEKLLMECVSSSTSILTDYYFNWPGSWAGYYLSFLCLLVLPVNLLVAYLSKTYEDRQMMVFMEVVTIVGCFIILRYGESYSIDQYLIGSLMIVVFSNMVEGPNMSLLSKTIPKAWRKGFLNVGLLATEAATMGRTAGDAYLALCGAGGLENQLNYTFGSMVILTVFTLWISYRYYDALIPTEDKTL